MKLLAGIWFIVAILYFILSWSHWKDSQKRMPMFESPQIEAGFGISRGDTDIYQPIQEFIFYFNLYISNQNIANHRQNLKSAFGYFVACCLALISLFISLRPSVPHKNKSTKHNNEGDP